jgi:uncharacterized protein YmfQ (DUF2313 family)
MKHTLPQHTKRLLDLLPTGELMRDKYDQETNQYKFWTAVAMLFVMVEKDWNNVIEELGISTTTYLIERWEKEFGIPDDVIDVAATLQERRDNVLLKKGGLNLLNIADFQDLVDRLGFDITIKTSSEIRFPPYSVPTIPLGDPQYKFIILMEGDMSDPNINYLVSFLEKLLPINDGIIEQDTNPAVYPVYLPYDVPFDL